MQHGNSTIMPVIGVARFERFFRVAAGLQVDKQDVKRHGEFVDRKLFDLLIRGEANAKANDRDIIEPQDLPITKGLQESIHAFRKIDGEVGLGPVLERLTPRPPLSLAASDATEAKLPEISAGLSFALGQAFTIIDPELKNPASEHWERAFRIFDLLL